MEIPPERCHQNNHPPPPAAPSILPNMPVEF